MTRAELLQRMSASEFAHWMALYDLERRERERAERDAQDKAKARDMARNLARIGG